MLVTLQLEANPNGHLQRTPPIAVDMEDCDNELYLVTLIINGRRYHLESLPVAEFIEKGNIPDTGLQTLDDYWRECHMAADHQLFVISPFQI